MLFSKNKIKKKKSFWKKITKIYLFIFGNEPHSVAKKIKQFQAKLISIQLIYIYIYIYYQYHFSSHFLSNLKRKNGGLSRKLHPLYFLSFPFSPQPNNGKSHLPLFFPSPLFHSLPLSILSPNQTQHKFLEFPPIEHT